jgi:signal transduction histidine kinase
VRALSREEAAQGHPVHVTGVITLRSPWANNFTVDDGTGIWVVPPEGDARSEKVGPGDLVELRGRSHEGHFAPVILVDRLAVVGRRPLPEPRVITLPDAESAAYDSQRVTLGGVVQAAEHVSLSGRRNLSLAVATPTGRFTCLVTAEWPTPPQQLVDAEVSVTGVMLSFFNARRQFLGARLVSNDPADLRIRRPAQYDAFAVPEVPLGGAMTFSPAGNNQHRHRVTGTVTLCKPGQYFYLQDDHHALRVRTRQPDRLRPGDVVEATGFFAMGNHTAEMHEAVFRRLGARRPPDPLEVTRSTTFAPEPRNMVPLPRDFDDYLVALRGFLVSFDHKHGEPLRLNLECDGALVSAEFIESAESAAVTALRPGSELRVSGVCELTFSDRRPLSAWPQPVAVRLLLRDRADVQVLAAVSWWTPERLRTALGVTALILLLALAWAALLRRTVAQRSHQLAEEMRARRDAAVEFESTLRERNRLAADLHDTTEQSLTGLALQLEASEALQTREPERSNRHLALARQLLARSREDLRRSIWNLRANPLENNSLTEALREIASDRSAGQMVRIVVKEEGNRRPLVDFVAGNLLLLAQEGITNALKHAGPARIDLCLRFADRAVTLEIRDDGDGFEADRVAGPKEGHFGLQGMRERIKRLGGTIRIASAPGRGTTIAATVPD